MSLPARPDQTSPERPAILRSRLLRAPAGVFGSLIRHRQLIGQMAMQEVRSRYRGSVLGLFWSFANPLLQLAIYTLVFGYIFEARWGIEAESGAGGGKLGFAVVLFSGLILHTFLIECLVRAPTLLHQHSNLVKRVVFPLEVLPWVVVASALFHLVVGLGVLLLAALAVFGSLPWTALLAPLTLASLVLMAAGVSWFLASTGLYFRDIAQATGPLAMILLFISPILFPVERLPVLFQKLILLNPLTIPVEQMRAVLIFGTLPDWPLLGWHFLAGLIVAWIGYYWFARTRKSFADIL
ncbi:ABC transporter permease [Oceanibaculum nanhaiense]|uniref:ABC transporter permease n=1 Tax=Oceanibaculum nanhaiense TaxID=1909734 RepID=UPI003F71AD88